MNGELLRMIDSIHRAKDIDLDILFGALEDALASALRKNLGLQELVPVTINRETGEVTREDTGEALDPSLLGRIAAQTAGQVFKQKTREAERDVIFRDYEGRLHDIVNGTIQRTEGGNVIVNLGRTEGFLPRREQVREEKYRVGDRIRCYVLDVRKAGSNVKIILSRSHPDLIRKLFELEVPEISERIIEIKELAREPGYRTKIAVYSIDSKVDAVGACVGVRGTRIKNIVAELGGEKIDIVRWSDQSDIFIANALNPAEIQAISLNTIARVARVIVAEDQLSRAIGSLGQNVRLASKLTEWDIDVMSQQELDGEIEKMKDALSSVPGVGDKTIAKLFAAGFSLKKLGSTSIDKMLTVEGVGESVADKIAECAAEFNARERERIRAEREAAAEAARRAVLGQQEAEPVAEAGETAGQEEQADEQEPDPAEPEEEAAAEEEDSKEKEETEPAEEQPGPESEQPKEQPDEETGDDSVDEAAGGSDAAAEDEPAEKPAD
jgi:N utilization substance protein A